MALNGKHVSHTMNYKGSPLPMERLQRKAPGHVLDMLLTRRYLYSRTWIPGSSNPFLSTPVLGLLD